MRDLFAAAGLVPVSELLEVAPLLIRHSAASLLIGSKRSGASISVSFTSRAVSPVGVFSTFEIRLFAAGLSHHFCKPQTWQICVGTGGTVASFRVCLALRLSRIPFRLLLLLSLLVLIDSYCEAAVCPFRPVIISKGCDLSLIIRVPVGCVTSELVGPALLPIFFFTSSRGGLRRFTSSSRCGRDFSSLVDTRSTPFLDIHLFRFPLWGR